jgi:CheY-like chemotaxis protein
MSATLLLADDSVTIQRVIELTFQNEDIRVIATSDGEAAIQRIDAEPPDIVLADVGMPKQDGYAVSAHVKKTPLLRQIPVLLLTGAFEPIDEDKARASGCDGILVKPFEPQQLVGRVRELLAGGKNKLASPERPFTMPSKPQVVVPAPAAVPALVRPTVAPAAPTLLVPRVAQPAPPPEPPPEPPAPVHDPPSVEDSFQREFDQLDAAFAKLDPEPAAAVLDEDTASDFARDLDLYRGSGDTDEDVVPGELEASPRPERPFGDWDLPDRPAVDQAPAVEASSVPRLAPRAVGLRGAPELPAAEAPPAPDTLETPAAGGQPRLSIASAFAAMLAAEQQQPGTAPPRPVTMSEATVEEIVRRVLSRMTDDAVRRIVHDTAEKLIREEIERIKSQ